MVLMQSLSRNYFHMECLGSPLSVWPEGSQRWQHLGVMSLMICLPCVCLIQPYLGSLFAETNQILHLWITSLLENTQFSCANCHKVLFQCLHTSSALLMFHTTTLERKSRHCQHLSYLQAFCFDWWKKQFKFDTMLSSKGLLIQYPTYFESYDFVFLCWLESQWDPNRNAHSAPFHFDWTNARQQTVVIVTGDIDVRKIKDHKQWATVKPKYLCSHTLPLVTNIMIFMHSILYQMWPFWDNFNCCLKWWHRTFSGKLTKSAAVTSDNVQNERVFWQLLSHLNATIFHLWKSWQNSLISDPEQNEMSRESERFLCVRKTENEKREELQNDESPVGSCSGPLDLIISSKHC